MRCIRADVCWGGNEMTPILDYLLIAASFGAACIYLFFVYRKKKCGGCGGEISRSSSRRVQIQIPKK